MKKPLYELGALRAALIQCDMNIASLQRGIDKEIEKKAELMTHIKKHEEYLKKTKGE